MKLKTHKTTAKKVKVSGGKRTKKFTMKRAGQDHFNARETGKATRNKRRDTNVAKTDLRNIKRQLPYS